MLIIADNFTGSVDNLDLTGNNSTIAGIKSLWLGGNGLVFLPASGTTLTKDIVKKFTLRNFSSFGGALFEAIEGYHLYGTKDGEDTVAQYGRLVAD